MTAPHELSVADAVARLDVRELTAEELVRDCLSRIAEREPRVQAWQVLAPDAIEQARRIDAQPQRPLLRGLPVGIKDLIDTKDLPTTYGSAIHAGHRPAAYVGGKTRNPHDPGRTPGGSSSGSAAAVADRMVPAALGSQTAGSVIRPASFCGAVGYKPTFGRFDVRGVHPLAPSLDTVGFFVREVVDVPWIAAALTGSEAPASIANLSAPPRLGLCRTDQWSRAEPPTQRLIEGAARELERAGSKLSDVDAFAGAAAAQAVIMAAEAAEVFRELRRSHDAELSPGFRAFLDEGERCPADRLREARHAATESRRELEDVFARVDALVTPAAAGEAPIGHQSTGDPAFCRAWTLLRCPCISLPVLEGPAGLPIGPQLVAAPDQDARLLTIAAWVEKHNK